MNVQQRHAEIIDARDENKNGYRELLILLNTMSQGGRWYGVFEYNGDEIVSVIAPKLGGIWLEATGDINYRDIDGNGISEIVAYLGLPVSDPYPGMPWRKEWDTYAWNGEFYVIVNTEFSSPEYRFQAAYDGDQSALSGKYKKALAFYQDVIFSDKLKWWTAERHSYESDLFYWDPPDSKPIMPDPDPNEYVNLAAYARYRIMLLYLLQGWESDAQVVYETLLAKYPEGTPGSIYTRLAQLFREEYQVSRDMGQACQAVIADANTNSSEVLKYLGIDGSLGMSIYYHIRDICPFE